MVFWECQRYFNNSLPHHKRVKGLIVLFIFFSVIEFCSYLSPHVHICFVWLHYYTFIFFVLCCCWLLWQSKALLFNFTYNLNNIVVIFQLDIICNFSLTWWTGHHVILTHTQIHHNLLALMRLAWCSYSTGRWQAFH